MSNHAEKEHQQMIAETTEALAKNQVPKHDWFPGLSEKHRQELLGATDEELNWEPDPQEAKQFALKELQDILDNPGQKDMIRVVLDALPNDFWLRWLAYRSKKPDATLQEFIPMFLQAKISPAD